MIIKDKTDKLNAISLVQAPATESNFLKLSKQIDLKLSFDEDKMEVTGAVLIPDQLIYRNIKGKEFEIFFSAETIKELSVILMAENNNNNSITLDHLTAVTDINIIELWTISDSNIDKSVALGLEPHPINTLMCTMKVNNIETWERVKNDELNGFSIEGILTPVLVDTDTLEMQLNKIIDILNA